MSVILPVMQLAAAELGRYEAVVERGRQAFLDVGRALAAIRDRRLYRDRYPSWEAYLEARWPDLGLRQANRDIAAARTVERLGPIGPALRALPATESQARPLTMLPDEHQADAWRRVVESAGDRPITAQHVQSVVAEVKAEHAARIMPAAIPEATAAAPFYMVEAWHRLPDAERRRIIAEASIGSETTFNRTNDNVDWAKWTWNPVTGCDHGCDYCYARVLANRYYTDLPEDERFAPVFRPSRLHAPRLMRVPAAYHPSDPLTLGEKSVFVCSMADLFGKWVPQDWIDAVFSEVVGSPDWNYLFLTKFPQRLAEQDWPENAWCGASVDRQARVATAERSFRNVTAGVRWLSCEPLLERLTFSDLSMFDWVVIGAQTANAQVPEFQPPFEWVLHLVNQAKAAGCRVYLKPNLRLTLREYPGAAP